MSTFYFLYVSANVSAVYLKLPARRSRAAGIKSHYAGRRVGLGPLGEAFTAVWLQTVCSLNSIKFSCHFQTVGE